MAVHNPSKLRKDTIVKLVIQTYMEKIVQPDNGLSLRVKAQLLLGLVKIYQRKVQYLYDDAERARREAVFSHFTDLNMTKAGVSPEEPSALDRTVTKRPRKAAEAGEEAETSLFRDLTLGNMSLQETIQNLVYDSANIGPGAGETGLAPATMASFERDVGAAIDFALGADGSLDFGQLSTLDQLDLEGMDLSAAGALGLSGRASMARAEAVRDLSVAEGGLGLDLSVGVGKGAAAVGLDMDLSAGLQMDLEGLSFEAERAPLGLSLDLTSVDLTSKLDTTSLVEAELLERTQAPVRATPQRRAAAVPAAPEREGAAAVSPAAGRRERKLGARRRKRALEEEVDSTLVIDNRIIQNQLAHFKHLLRTHATPVLPRSQLHRDVAAARMLHGDYVDATVAEYSYLQGQAQPVEKGAAADFLINLGALHDGVTDASAVDPAIRALAATTPAAAALELNEEAARALDEGVALRTLLETSRAQLPAEPVGEATPGPASPHVALEDSFADLFDLSSFEPGAVSPAYPGEVSVPPSPLAVSAPAMPLLAGARGPVADTAERLNRQVVDEQLQRRAGPVTLLELIETAAERALARVRTSEMIPLSAGPADTSALMLAKRAKYVRVLEASRTFWTVLHELTEGKIRAEQSAPYADITITNA